MSELWIWILLGGTVGLFAGMCFWAYVRGVQKRNREEETLLEQLKQLLEGKGK